LGAGALLLIFFGLVLVCGLCFGLGYFVGRRGVQPASASGQQPASGEQTPLQPSGSLPKPSAIAQASAPQPAQNATQQTPSTDPPQSKVAVPVASPQASAPAALSSPQPQVHSAFAPEANSPQAAAPANVHPAFPPAAPLMVQIAAISHQEDADVLVGALHKRGYQVSARRDPADNLIHVRIGPFNDHDEAERWRLKLLNDGYNAMIQP
jgi:cell division septation protein DedD